MTLPKWPTTAPQPPGVGRWFLTSQRALAVLLGVRRPRGIAFRWNRAGMLVSDSWPLGAASEHFEGSGGVNAGNTVPHWVGTTAIITICLVTLASCGSPGSPSEGAASPHIDSWTIGPCDGYSDTLFDSSPRRKPETGAIAIEYFPPRFAPGDVVNAKWKPAGFNHVVLLLVEQLPHGIIQERCVVPDIGMFTFDSVLTKRFRFPGFGYFAILPPGRGEESLVSWDLDSPK